MSWLASLVGKGPLSDKKIEKMQKLITNPFAQPDVRKENMEKLLAEGSDAAISAAIKRFSANAHGTISDEEEKQWLEERLVLVGSAAKAPLEHYIKNEQQLTYALRAYRKIVGEAEAAAFFAQALKRHSPENYRTTEHKLQLIWQLSDFLDYPSSTEILADFIRDHSDEVRWAAIDVLLGAHKAGKLGEPVRLEAAQQLCESLMLQEASQRIQTRVAEVLCEQEWAIPEGIEGEFPTTLEELFFLDKKRFVRRRLSKN